MPLTNIAPLCDLDINCAALDHSNMHNKIVTFSPYLETNKRDLHGEDGAQAVDCAVSHIDSVRESAREHQNQHVEGDEVDQEHVATPGRNLDTHKHLIRTSINSEFTQ